MTTIEQTILPPSAVKKHDVWFVGFGCLCTQIEINFSDLLRACPEHKAHWFKHPTQEHCAIDRPLGVTNHNKLC